MGSFLRVGLVAALTLSSLYGCDDEAHTPESLEDELADEDDFEDEDWLVDGSGTPPADAPPAQTPSVGQRSEVPAELVGAWAHGYIDFALWENYRPGQWAGRDAIPSREAMVFSKNGEARFYRYEFARNLYEELIDCEGTVAFHGDGTFTFYPIRGRKRFIDNTQSHRSTDRALTAAELAQPKLAGKRAYTYVTGASPETVRITVPSSAPYNWYKQE